MSTKIAVAAITVLCKLLQNVRASVYILQFLFERKSNDEERFPSPRFENLSNVLNYRLSVF